MSTYQELRGLKVKYLAANPDQGTAGDVWYDSATYELKGFVGRAAWSAGALMTTARTFIASTGTQTAGLAFGGGTGSPNVVAHSEYYDGTNWSTSPNIGSTRYNVTGAGTATAAGRTE